MAGTIPTKRSTSGRKQWTLHDGSRGTLKRLRNQLANEGCPESQVVLAKQLLEDETDLNTNNENARLGVYWLIKASEQGNTEATELLKECLATGKGITEHNYLDVKSCITMTQDEKLARKAAKEMFASLSNGGEYITSEQLQRKMLSIDREQRREEKNYEELGNGEAAAPNGELMNHFEESESEEEIDWSQKSDSNEKLTEDHLVEAAVRYAHGQLPAVNRVLCLNDPNLQSLDHIPVMQRSVLHPFLALKILYYKLIRFLGSFWKTSCFKSDYQIFFILFFYTVISSENILYIFPMIIYYSTIVVMVVTTFTMLQTKREFYDFRIWSGLFISYSGGSMNSEEAEFQFIRNNLKPYGQFFLALLVNLLVYPVIAEQYIPQSELTVFSFCLTFMTLFGFMYKRRAKTVMDVLILFSFAVNVLAKYPYETDPVVTQGWRFIDLKIPTFASYIIGNGIEFCITFRIFLYTLIPAIIIRIAYRENWRGIYKYVIPHCVTLSWLQIVIISSQGATMFGLIRGTLALVGFVLFLPLVGLTTIFLPAAALAKWFVTNDYIYTISIFILLALTGISVFHLLAKSRFGTYTSVLQLICALVAIYSLCKMAVEDPALIHTKEPVPKTISYEHFQKFCLDHAWENLNVASAQIRCAKLQNTHVNWDGYIREIKIKSIKNRPKYIADKLPTVLSKVFYCYYGDKIKPVCKTDDLHDCLTFYDSITSNNPCTLDKYNLYEFEISIRMVSGIWGKSTDITLNMGDGFRNFTFELRADDHIWFKGTLQQNINRAESIGFTPHVSVKEIGCLACRNVELTNMKEVDGNGYSYRRLLKDLTDGLKTVLNFIFYPVIVFK